MVEVKIKDKLCTIKEASELSGIPESTLYKHAKQNTELNETRIGGSVYIRLSELNRIIVHGLPKIETGAKRTTKSVKRITSKSKKVYPWEK